MIQEEIAKDLLSGDDEETQSSADDLTPSVTSHEATDFFPRPLRCRKSTFITALKTVLSLHCHCIQLSSLKYQSCRVLLTY